MPLFLFLVSTMSFCICFNSTQHSPPPRPFVWAGLEMKGVRRTTQDGLLRSKEGFGVARQVSGWVSGVAPESDVGGPAGQGVGGSHSQYSHSSVKLPHGNFGCLLQWFRFLCLPRAPTGGNDGKSTRSGQSTTQ